MKRILTLLLIAVLVAVSSVSAGSIDSECQAHGFNFGVAKWEWNDELGIFELKDHIDNHGTNVEGNQEEASWTADPAVDGVLTKQGNDYLVFGGGTNGLVSEDMHGISHITFCRNNEEIPEFSTITAGIALVVAMGFTFYRRKKL